MKTLKPIRAGQPQSALEALTATASLAEKLENADFEIPPRSMAQREPANLEIEQD